MEKPFSRACENNKVPILEVLRRHLTKAESVLEVGSGTGQHAVWFAQAFPQLVWQTSDLLPSHEGIRAWIEESGLTNVREPIELDVMTEPWPMEGQREGPEPGTQAVFSANTAHIMSEVMVEAFIAGVGRNLAPKGLFLLYGPFNYGGEYTSESNARFDGWLKERDPRSAIRHFEWIEELAQKAGMDLVEDNAMPANNRLLVFRSTGA